MSTPEVASASPNSRRGKELSGVRAIVTNADSRLGLYVIRSLGRSGCHVTALAHTRSKRVIGFSSRYAAGRHQLPDGDYPVVLVDEIERLAPTHDVVIPVSTLSIGIVDAAQDRLAGKLRHFIPDLASLRIAMDKAATTHAAEEAGIPVPRTYHELDPSSIESWAAEAEDRFPLVVKYADDRRTGGGWSPADRYRIVGSPSELVREYQRMAAVATHANPVVQEYVEGDGYGFFAVMDATGEPVATFCHKRLREYPISGGPSTLCESYHDETLVELGTRLLKALGWRGVAMVEFKQDRRTGEYKLLEINPRFWGSLPLALHCGVDFPVYQAQLALGRTPQAPDEYPVGKKMRYFVTDALAVMQEWRSGDKRRVAREYLSQLLDPSIKDGLFELRDPRPFLTYARQRFGT